MSPFSIRFRSISNCRQLVLLGVLIIPTYSCASQGTKLGQVSKDQTLVPANLQTLPSSTSSTEKFEDAWGSGADEKVAKRDAVRQAVLKLQGNYIDSNSVVENDQIIKDEIRVWTRWPNLRSETLEREIGPPYRVKVRVWPGESVDSPRASSQVGVAMDGPGIIVLRDAEVENNLEAAHSIDARLKDLVNEAFQWDVFGREGQPYMAGIKKQHSVVHSPQSESKLELVIRLRSPYNLPKFKSSLAELRIALAQIATAQLNNALIISSANIAATGPVRKGEIRGCMTRHPHDLLIPNSSEQSVLVSVIQDEALVGFDQFIIPKACLKKFETLDLLYVRLLDQKGNNLAQAAIDLNPLPYLVNFNSLVAPARTVVVEKNNGNLAGVSASTLKYPLLKWGFQRVQFQNISHKLIYFSALSPDIVFTDFGNCAKEVEIFVSIPISDQQLTDVAMVVVVPRWSRLP